MLDLEQTPEIPATVVTCIDAGGDDLFDKLQREMQVKKIEKLKAYFAQTPTPVARETRAVSGAVLLHLAKCPNKPEGHDGGDPCVGVNHDGSHFYRCQHKNCAGLTWEDVEQVYGPLNPPAAKPEASKPRILTCKELDSAHFDIVYHIKDTFAAVQPALIGGRQKTLKTSIAIDGAISLATGLPFLGRLAVTKPAKVLILSGESGLPVLQETARRVSMSKGTTLSGVDGLYWSDWLPKFDNPGQMTALEKTIDETGCEVLFVDPCYLAMPGSDAGNVFVQGTMLRRISDVCQSHGVCPVLLHHLRKRGKGDHSYDPPELDELAWAGFGEFARQWWLLGRRELYEPGTGEHRLWLSIGGSAGHSGLWAVDIDEGVAGEPRRWDVRISTSVEAKEAKKSRTVRDRLIAAAREYPAGETKTTILETAGLKSDATTRNVFDGLVRDLLLLPIKVLKNGTKYDGFVLGEVKP